MSLVDDDEMKKLRGLFDQLESTAVAFDLSVALQNTVQRYFATFRGGKVEIEAVVYACGELLTSALATIPDPGQQGEMLCALLRGLPTAIHAKNRDQDWYRAAEAGVRLKLQ